LVENISKKDDCFMNDTRFYWIITLQKICEMPLELLAKDELKNSMPVEAKNEERKKYTHLELLARILCGISPFLELNANMPGTDIREREIALHLLRLARKSLDIATCPDCRDYMNFEEGAQPLVDAAFLAQAIIRAPKSLWEQIDPSVRKRLIEEMKKTRKIKPYYSNWLLFSAMIEAFMFFAGEEWDKTKVDLILKAVDGWYKGDGVYGDGPLFRWDYYNSFVIYPMLIDILKVLYSQDDKWKELETKVIERAQRYAVVLERLISPEGTFPIIGRSITYRTAVFHLLALLSLYRKLPSQLSPAQVRCGLTAVLKKVFEKKGVFDEKGWLRIGVAGAQPLLGEDYISTGSLYLCTTVFLPLGVPQSDPFWKDPCEDWTNKKVWEGLNVKPDKAIEY